MNYEADHSTPLDTDHHSIAPCTEQVHSSHSPSLPPRGSTREGERVCRCIRAASALVQASSQSCPSDVSLSVAGETCRPLHGRQMLPCNLKSRCSAETPPHLERSSTWGQTSTRPEMFGKLDPWPSSVSSRGRQCDLLVSEWARLLLRYMDGQVGTRETREVTHSV